MEDTEIDDSLYSRQRYVLGDSAMQKLAKSHILIVGLGGLGVEIAKNVVLAGVKSVTLLDNTVCEEKDLGVQFFINAEDIKAKLSRAVACHKHLSELNPHVDVKVSCEEISTNLKMLAEFQCVVVTELTFQQQIIINNYCRKLTPQVCFISTDVRGVFSYSFCDFGDEFYVSDQDGEEYTEKFVGNITKANPAVVGTLESRFHGLQSNDKVQLKDLRNGMEELTNKTFEVRYLTPYTFSINCDTSTFEEYRHGGSFIKVKQPLKLQFKSLEEQLKNPDVLINDLSKMQAPLQTHVAMHSLSVHLERGNRVESLKDDYEKLLEIAQSLDVENVDEGVLKMLCRTGCGQLVPLCAAMGGIVSQEVLKAISGKFTPLKQFLYLDATELVTDKTHTVLCGRYAMLSHCLSDYLLARLSKLNLFMVGCGAIGCEFLKNFALLGVATHGQVTVTDNDLIEKSNLNRQFLFRPWHIQQSKSVTASNATKIINPDICIEAQQNKVCLETEKQYPDDFFQKFDVVVNALDNVEARRYVDGRCVSNTKPLIETGTMGSKGHVQVVVPHMTESYSNQRDPVDEDVPYCTLKSFPQRIEHTIQWARDKFDSLFTVKPETFNKFWSKHNEPQTLVKAYERDRDIPEHFIAAVSLLRNRPADWRACLQLAYLKFSSYFHNKALQLLHAFPLDTRLPDGSLFWQSPRNRPTPIKFDAHNTLHTQFVISYAKIIARVCSIEAEPVSLDDLSHIVENVKVPQFKASAKKIEIDEKASKDDVPEDNDDKINKLIAYLKEERNFNVTTLSAEHFEKDDDNNSHIDFITATSNLRAMMYDIDVADRYKTKRIAGRIIPAIATTTAAIAGLATIELLKVVAQLPIEKLKNCFLNLALPLMVLSEPAIAPKTKIADNLEYTCWDRWDVRGHKDFKLNDFIQHFKDKYSLSVNMVCHGLKMVYMPIMPGHSKRLNQDMIKLLKLPPEVMYVDLIISFDLSNDEEELPAPPIRYFFK